jgi:hypothetical protein
MRNKSTWSLFGPSVAVTIDVKGLKNTTNWVVTPKLRTQRHFFVLVCYRNRFSDASFLPESYVVPSLAVDEVLETWAGNRAVTCIGYRNVKEGRFPEAWSLMLS